MGKIAVFAIACCLLPTMAGCMRLPIRHGVIVKGDWSLEMNRIPWMKGRGDAYQETSDCGAIEGVCTTEVDSPFVTNATRTLSPQSRVRHCGKAGCGSAARREPSVGYQAHARFHPVPTRPTFASEPSLARAMTEQTSPAALPPARSAPKSLEPPPLPPEMESIPTPQASPTSSPDQAAANGATAPHQLSWVFSLTPPESKSAPDDDQRYVAGGTSRPIR